MTNKELFENYLSVVLEESTQKIYMTRIGKICSELDIEDLFSVEDISLIDEWLSVVSTMDFDIKNGGSYTSSLRKYREFIKVKNLFSDGKEQMIQQFDQDKNNQIERNYTLEELGNKLHDEYENTDKGKIVTLYLFVFEYASYLIDKYTPRELIRAARLNDSFSTEINKAYNIYKVGQSKRIFKEFRYKKRTQNISDLENRYLSAIRTKPFLLLAGISGTGKSRIVKQLAYMSCPDYGGLRDSEVAPGNYCMIEVKPNWHDSTELLGYESMINNRYVMTPFVQFLIKAMRFPNVPFFVCLDEMNLAPVEQYFAEFLSVLESRKRLNDGRIVSEPLIKAEIFNNYGEVKQEQNKSIGLFDEIKISQGEIIKKEEVSDENIRSWDEVICQLRREGLCIPQNVIVVGTVNMDETTHQFSRKVIDRAMTIEMNIGEDISKYFNDFFESNEGLGYYENEMPKEMFLSSYTSATEAMEDNEGDAEEIKSIVPKLLAELNECLKNTPFEVAYRVQNELIMYICELRREYVDKSINELVAMAMDDILMMKVLPRIEGDDMMLKGSLIALLEFCDNKYLKAYKKVKEMQMRLKSHFTSYWP